MPYAVKKNDNKVYPNHVGVLLDALLCNPWWGSRTTQSYRHVKIDAAQARANGRNLRKYFA